MNRPRMTPTQMAANKATATKRAKLGMSKAVVDAKEAQESAASKAQLTQFQREAQAEAGTAPTPAQVNRSGNANSGKEFQAVRAANGHEEHVYGDGHIVDMGPGTAQTRRAGAGIAKSGGKLGLGAGRPAPDSAQPDVQRALKSLAFNMKRAGKG
ncbi:hypothetical protein NBH00_05165 [Paraconexibacter antarcticus]|uniref:Uncharacterized protein n=1 Tax=Paraconexibacter antarcticus TaxID=2949664 RepID=A0ABY5DU94_9ACTN|nr:hypothetical protein [Paraconexibacter antarcticus]UTI65600.1 hypothetical protein NBH00_05165 [Paraconexibacter antarcticus]